MIEWLTSPQDPMIVVGVIIVLILLNISSKLSKIIDKFDALATENRYAQEAAGKAYAEIETIETRLGYIDDNISQVINEHFPPSRDFTD